jgi:hypothetical protein
MLWDQDNPSTYYHNVDFNDPRDGNINPPLLIPTTKNPSPKKTTWEFTTHKGKHRKHTNDPKKPYGPFGPLPPGKYTIDPSTQPGEEYPKGTPTITQPGSEEGCVDTKDGHRDGLRCHGSGGSEGCLTYPKVGKNPFYKLLNESKITHFDLEIVEDMDCSKVSPVQF